MTNIVGFPGSGSLSLTDRLSFIVDDYKNSITPRLRLHKHIVLEDYAERTAVPEDFGLLVKCLHKEYTRLGRKVCLEILGKIEEESFFSRHICQKLRTHIERGDLVFEREAQFASDAIRRPERNLFYAYTFTTLATRFLCRCFERSDGQAASIAVANVGDLSRGDLRFLQSLLLYPKTFSLVVNLGFAGRNPDAPHEDKNPHATAARKKALYRLLSVASMTDALIDVPNVASFLDEVDLRSPLLTTTPFDTDELDDLLYKSEYETFFIASGDRPRTGRILRFYVLALAYTYQFDAAIEEIDQHIRSEAPKDQCYLWLIKGLIELKKQQDSELSRSSLTQGLKVARLLENPLQRIYEIAYLQNALNFVRLVDAMKQPDKTHRSAELLDILKSEYELLGDVCGVYTRTNVVDLQDEETNLSAVFIITTLVENIGKLNTLLGLREENILLHEQYHEILRTQDLRMTSDEYKASYKISYSHALITIGLMDAEALYHLGHLQDAIELITELRNSLDRFDVTGNYRALVHIALAICLLKDRKTKEAKEEFVIAAEILHAYNDPHMMRVAFRGIWEAMDEKDKAFFSPFLNTPAFSEKEVEASFNKRTAPAAVDLENSLFGGLEISLFMSSVPAAEAASFIHRGPDLNQTFRVYQPWRTLSAQQ